MPPKTTSLVLGIVLLVGAAFFLVAMVGFLAGTGSSSPDPGLAAFSATCMAIFAVPGLLSLLIYRRSTLMEQRTTAVAMLLQNVREVSIGDVARTIRETPSETVVLVNAAIASGRLRGYINPQAGTFVNAQLGAVSPPWVAATAPGPAAMPSEVPFEPRFCRECGSSIERTGAGPTYRCATCGHVESL